MRKYLKKKLMSMVDTLKKAETSLKELCKMRESQEQCAVLLEEMQRCGIEIGEAIEKTEGAGTQSVALLEQYCELLWECLNAAPGPARQHILKDIQSVRTAIQKQIQSEFAEICEILFLPYKASMWDSMESIYKAFCSREDCHCILMPIPYYSKNPDGSLGQEYYEGELYPDDVMVTHYEDYNVSEHCPEAVIIHNPYDDMNYVTSVHPSFYARNLKPYTDCLVYVSYFIINSSIRFELCQTPAALLSDLVIVQSEAIRETYIQAIEEWMQRMGREGTFSRSALEKKFQALGSPKADKVLMSKKDNISLPETWKKMAEGKRTVLYNTGLAGILKGNEQELIKIEDVMEIFRGREDSILWWRPHPLSDATCASMRPQLLERYRELVRRYQEESMGIYDDTPDLHRAIAWTDFYYGDSSSLTVLYGLAGKPVVIQNQSVLNKVGDNDSSLLYTASAEDGGDIWFSARNFNGLFHMNRESKTVDYLGEVPCETYHSLFLFTEIIKDGDYLWLIPGRAAALVKYNIKEEKFTRYELPNEWDLQAKDIKFCSGRLEDGKICLIPAEQPYFASFDIPSETWKIDDVWKKRLEKKYGVRLRAPYFYDFLIMEQEKSILLPVHGTNFLIEYSTDTYRAKIDRIGDNDVRFSYISRDGGDIFLAPRDWSGKLYRWCRQSGNVELTGAYPEQFTLGACIGLLVMQHTAYLMPSVGKGILKIDLNTSQSKLLTLGDRKLVHFYSIKGKKNMELVASISDYGGNKTEVIVFDEDGVIKNKLAPTVQCTDTLRRHNPFGQIEGSHAPKYTSGCIIWEMKENPLEQMLSWPDCIASPFVAAAYQTLVANPDGSCGKKISDAILAYLN